MNPNPVRVVHLFAESVSGFLPRLWLHQMLHLEPTEFRFSMVLPDRSSLGAWAEQLCEQRGIEIHEIPALAQLKNPVYALRARLSLGSWCPAGRVDVLHTHFPGAALLAGAARRRLAGVGLVHSLYSFAGDWKLNRPPRLLCWGLRRTTRRAERIITQGHEEEARVLQLEIGKRYQLARLPLAIPSGHLPSVNREEMAESLALPGEDRWIGIFLPSLSRRETRELLMNLVPLSEIAPGHQFLCVVPAGRLSESRTLGLRLRLSPRFHFVAGLSRWDEIASELNVAVFPMLGLINVAAAEIALGAACPVWIRADSPWVDLLPRAGRDVVCRGQAYRLKEEVESLLAGGKQASEEALSGETLADVQAEQVAGRLRGVYLDVVAEKASGSS